jgi:hypothetical protein
MRPDRKSGTGFATFVASRTQFRVPDMKCEILVKSCDTNYGIICITISWVIRSHFSKNFPKQKACAAPSLSFEKLLPIRNKHLPNRPLFSRTNETFTLQNWTQCARYGICVHIEENVFFCHFQPCRSGCQSCFKMAPTLTNPDDS